MKGRYLELEKLFAPLQSDGRTGPAHLCVYLALVQVGKGNTGWFFIRREEVMRLAKMRGLRTYYRVMKELAEWGFVEYRASRNRKTGSRVRISG